MAIEPYWRRALAATVAGSLVVGLLAAPASADPGAGRQAAANPTRGTLLSATPVAHLTRDELVAILTQIPFDTTHARYGVSGYRITYRTVDTTGRATTASGLVVLPDGGPARLPVIEYDHGTRVYRSGVASVEAGNGDREAVELFASAGFAAVAPDYLGLGTGPGHHPYMHAASETTAAVDILDAARTLAHQHGRQLDRRVMLTGFSQGGHAAMATGRALTAQPGKGWRVAAIAPVSGPFDVQHVEIPGMFSADGLDPKEAAFYIGYWTISMNRLYPLYRSPSEVFRAPYDATLEALYNGDHPEEEIFAALPANPTELLTPEYVQRLLHPTGSLLKAMRDNDDTCRWRPEAPVRLYAATGDRDALFANALHCQADLRERGVDAQLVNVGDVDHVGSAVLSIPQVLDWFSRLA